MVRSWQCGATAHIYGEKKLQIFTSVHLFSQMLSLPGTILNFSVIHKIEKLLSTKALSLSKKFLQLAKNVFSSEINFADYDFY